MNPKHFYFFIGLVTGIVIESIMITVIIIVSI